MGCVVSLTYSEGDGSLTGAGGMPLTGGVAPRLAISALSFVAVVRVNVTPVREELGTAVRRQARLRVTVLSSSRAVRLPASGSPVKMFLPRTMSFPPPEPPPRPRSQR